MSFLSQTSESVFVAGHRGLVGSALVRCLRKRGFSNLILRSRQELDLLDQRRVIDFFQTEKPKYVFLAAARVGGIKANSDGLAEFLYENLMIQCNVIHAAAEAKVEKLLFLGSSCVYPKLAPQPIREESLLTGPLEPSNEGYALAKIAGLKLCQYLNQQKGLRFISAMPTNLYGPNDNFDPEKSHVIPALLGKFHRAKISQQDCVELWGTGTPRREFLHSDDCAEALVTLMDQYEKPHTVNVGTGQDGTIRELAHLIRDIVGFQGDIRFNPDYPDGTPQKLLEVSKIFSMGWRPQLSLEQGLRQIYQGALKQGRVLD